MKLLEGYVRNRTKEAALAAIMLALFLVARTFNIRLLPGIMLADCAAPIVYTSVVVLSWVYVPLFALATLYQGSNIYVFLAFLIDTQVTFFVSKLVPRKWVPHTIAVGNLVGFPIYAAMLHVTGVMDFRVFFVVGAPIILWTIIWTYVGGLMLWRALMMFGVLDRLTDVEGGK